MQTEEINRALQVLRNGGIILYPTDTIWGIGCDATNELAVNKIKSIKQRAGSKSFVVLMNSTAMVERYTNDVPEIGFELFDVADEPLTLILPGARNLAADIIASDGSVGIRIPKHDTCIALISRLGKPLVSTSANISGMSSPANFREIPESIIRSVDYIIKEGENQKASGKPSSIIKVQAGGVIKIIRE